MSVYGNIDIFDENEYLIPVEEKWVKRIILGLLIGLAVFMVPALKSIFFIALFVAVNMAIAYFIRDFVHIPLGIEAITFTVILLSVAYSPWVGAFAGIFSLVMHYLISHRYVKWAVITIPAYVALAFLASAFAGANITSLGITLTLIYLVATVGGAMFMGGRLHKGMTWGLSNFAINIFLFTKIAPIFAAMMGVA